MGGQRIAVDARDENLPNSEIADQEEDSTLIADQTASCKWNGTEYSDGDSVCAQGVAYECSYGKWMKLPDGC
jgi:hypothetical protein